MTRDRLATVVPRSFPVEVRSSVEVHKVLRLPRHLHIGGSQSAAPATKYAHGVHNVLHPATKSAHGGSQSAAPAT